MDGLLYTTQEYPAQKKRVSELTIRALKEIFPSLSENVKDSASLKIFWPGTGIGQW